MVTVKSSARTLKLLEIIASNPHGLTFSDIQERLEIPKSSAFALIQELISQNYLMYSDDTKKYFPWINFMKMAANFIEGADLIQEMRLLTEKLSDMLQTTSHSAILDGTDIVYISKTQPKDGISLMKNIGIHLPAHCTAVGKMLLSKYSDDYIKKLYKDFSFIQMTEKSINNVDDLIINLRDIRKKEYSLDIQESCELACCIAVPVYQKGELVSAFSCTYRPFVFNKLDLDNTLKIMRECKITIEGRLNSIL